VAYRSDLESLVVRLQRWRIKRRGFAVLIVTFLSAIVFCLLAFAFGYPLVNGITHLANNLPTTSVTPNTARLDRPPDLQVPRHQVGRRQFRQTGLLRPGLSKPALALGKGAISILVAMITLFAFVVLLLLEGPKIRNSS